MDRMSLGVMGRSHKENERRLPLHPAHLRQDPDVVRKHVFLEHGYGHDFGLSDDQLSDAVAGLRTHEQLLDECDIILQPKPLHEDIAELRAGQTFLGWSHCVQDEGLTQLAIDQNLTMIAFEAMNHWRADGSLDVHVFHKNNEMAGYCSVLHALQLAGTTGRYGRRLRAVVVGFGATARGAVTALAALGVPDVEVLTRRDVEAVAAPILSARLVHLDVEQSGSCHAVTDDGPVPLPAFLGAHDIIVNCIRQDTDAPLMLLTDKDLPSLSPGTVIVDVSCDEGMGFSWARPTTFTEPTFAVGNNVLYYAVDHSPSYLWNSATWEISAALSPLLPSILDGPDSWHAHPTIDRAIEIREGVIQNPAILSFQDRDPNPPHAHLTT